MIESAWLTSVVIGVEGIPLPYLPGRDDVVSLILLGCFLASAYVLSYSYKFLLQLGNDFLLHRERASIFATSTGSDMRYLVSLVMQTCVLSGLYIFLCFSDLNPNLVSQAGSLRLVGICVGGCMIYLCLKWLVYSLLGWIFFDRGIRSFWMNSYSTLLYYFGLFLFPALLLVVYLDLSLQNTVIIGLFLFGLVKMLILYKWIKLFCDNFFGGLLLILYFCALEIIPCLLLYKGMTQLNDYWIIKF